MAEGLAETAAEMRAPDRIVREARFGVIDKAAVGVAPLLTEIVPLDDTVRAFELTGNRSRAMKVRLAL